MTQRILILGAPGSGKSTLAIALSQMTGLPVIHFEHFVFEPGWVVRPLDQIRALNRQALHGDHWIQDGSWRMVWDEVLPRAELVLFIDLPAGRSLIQALWRALRDRGLSTPDLAPGCQRRLDWKLLRMIWRYRQPARRRTLRQLRRLCTDTPVVTLTLHRDIRTYLRALPPSRKL